VYSGDEDEDVVYLSVLVSLHTLCLQCSAMLYYSVLYFAIVYCNALCYTTLHRHTSSNGIKK
jgi:hypothetical protein